MGGGFRPNYVILAMAGGTVTGWLVTTCLTTAATYCYRVRSRIALTHCSGDSRMGLDKLARAAGFVHQLCSDTSLGTLLSTGSSNSS